MQLFSEASSKNLRYSEGEGLLSRIPGVARLQLASCSDFCELRLSFLVSLKSSDVNTSIIELPFVLKRVKDFLVYFSHRVERDYACKRHTLLLLPSASVFGE